MTSSIGPNSSPHCQSTPCSKAATGISSISRNIAPNDSRCGARTGAMLNEQLPVTTVVTPCSMAGNTYGSNST